MLCYPVVVNICGSVLQQALANYSTSPRYSKNIQYSANIGVWILGWIVVRYLARPRVEYLYATQYLIRGRVTWPQSINFMTRLRLSLGYIPLVFASTMNLESGPRLAGICSAVYLVSHLLVVLNLKNWLYKAASLSGPIEVLLQVPKWVAWDRLQYF